MSYAAAVEAELGRDVAIRLDRLADLAENGGADFAAAEMERIGTDLGLREGCLGRSRIEHQAGVAYRFVLGGARHQTLRKSHDLLERAYACKERKRYPRAWGETALHLAHTYRDIGRELSTAEQQHAWSKSERLLDEALRAFETEGLPGAFHCASTLQSIANLAAERGDTKKARRFNKAARELIEKRVGSLGWDDVTMTNPRGLYACVAANSVTSLQREGTPLSLSQAAKELEHSLLEVDDPRIRFRLAQVYSLQGKVDQANLDSLTSMEVTTVLNTQDLDAVPVLLSEGELTQKVDAFFQGVIAMLARVRGDQRGHDSDHTAARLGHFCRHWAKLLAKNGEPFAAFCAVESNAALRMQEAARFHQWRPRDAEQAALYEEWTVRAELASVFTGWSAKLASMPPALRALFVASVRSQLDPNHPESPGIGDELEGRTLDRLWHEFQRLDGSLTPDEALRRHAETLGDEATEIRMKLETDARFVRAQSSLPPIDEDGLKALLIENKGRALLRLEYFSDEVLGLYGDVDPSGAPRALVYPVSFPAEILGLIDVREMWEHGSISEAALSALSKIDLLGGIPHDGPRNVVLLQSGGMALLPTLAIGPPGATLLDRFDSVQTLWSIAPLRVRPAAMEERSGTLALYPGREIQFDDDKSTVFHSIASSGIAGRDVVEMGKGASLRQVTEAWSRARVVSFYGHGEHIQMGGAAEQVGPQLLLGTGELLGMRSLQWSTFGIERAELWACRTGIDVPWDPAFPMGDGFGFDYELIRSGVRSTVGTLWSVDELATSLIVLRYRTAVAQGRHAAGALADAQRWWRDISGPAIRNSDRVVDTICQLWRDILGRDPGENERGIRAFLSAKQSDGKKWKALMTSLTSPIAHAAYRFCGLIHEPVGVPALRLPHQPDRASAKEIQRIDLRELERFPIIRRSDSVTTEVDAFYDEATDALGLVVHDNFDGDFGYIVLARESRDAPFRFVDGDASFPEQALAEAALVDAIRSRRSDPTVVRALAER